MKRVLAVLLALTLCLGVMSVGSAEEMASPFFHTASWRVEDVDVSDVKLVDGRLVGTIKLPPTDLNNWASGEVRVDCPLPEYFTKEQQVKLHVAYQSIGKKQLLKVLKDMGQRAAEEQMWAYSDGSTMVVDFTSLTNIDSGFYPNRLRDASLSGDPAYAKEYAQAKDAMRSIVKALGGSVAENLLHANRRDNEHRVVDGYKDTTNGDELRAMGDQSFLDGEKKYGRTEQVYTAVSGLYELCGLPVMDQYYWKDGKDWMGAACTFQAVMKDDDTLCNVQISGVPKLVSTEPMEMPEYDWQALLKSTVAMLMATNAHSEDFKYEDLDGNTQTAYATYAVITEIKPCWVSQELGVLEPGWYCVSEDRVVKDDSISMVWEMYGDAATMMRGN